ncbi:patatin-like phospholipase family protein [bacterium]|nr:patatin-like phospholipase family protein [bacterium]
MTDRGIKHLIVEGAGFGGLANCGAFQELDDRGILTDIHYFGGSSSGALLVSLLAMGITANELVDVFATYDFDKVLSRNPFKMVWNLFRKFGLWTPDKIISEIKTIIRVRDKDPEITFKELLDSTGNFLVVTASSLNEQKCIYINPLSHPNVKVMDAVRASISIPLFFVPSTQTFTTHPGLTVDGGLMDNFPVWIFDEHSALVSEPCSQIPSNTLGLKIVNESEKNILKTPSTLRKYLMRVVTLAKQQMERTIESPSYKKQVVEILIPDEITTVDFDITEQDRQELFNIGRNSVRSYLDVIKMNQ